MHWTATLCDGALGDEESFCLVCEWKRTGDGGVGGGEGNFHAWHVLLVGKFHLFCQLLPDHWFGNLYKYSSYLFASCNTFRLVFLPKSYGYFASGSFDKFLNSFFSNSFFFLKLGSVLIENKKKSRELLNGKFYWSRRYFGLQINPFKVPPELRAAGAINIEIFF